MQIEAEGFDALEVRGEEHLRRAVEFMSAKEGPTFVIVSKSPQEYVQVAFHGECDLIECRRGDSAQHFKAVRSNDPENEAFSKDEVAEVFAFYWRGELAPTWLTWQKIAV